MVIKDVYVPGKNGIIVKDLFIDEEGIITDKLLNDSTSSIYDGSEKYVVPGFIDCHTHGFKGYGSEDSSEGLKKLALQYASRGTLGFYATVGPRAFEKYLELAKEYRSAFFDKEYEGARFLGLHLEGPFLNPDKAGAIDPLKMYEIQLEEFEGFIKAAGDVVKVMTIAPELENGPEAIRLMRKYGIIPSLGHTNAGYEEAIAGIEAGANHITHTFNAMRPFNHREPGILGAAFLRDEVFCELIADGVHVAKEVMLTLLKLKGMERVMAVSDGGKSCGFDYPEGFRLEDGSIIARGAVYSKDGNTLCGSTRDLYSHFKGFIKEYGFSIHEACLLTSENASRHFNLDFGRIEEGFKANLLVLDKDLNIVDVIINGVLQEEFI